MGMTQARYGLGFPVQPLAKLVAAGPIRGENFEGDFAVQSYVARAVYLTHTASADGREDFIRSQPCSRSKGHGVPSNCTVREIRVPGSLGKAA
jgi:hypothetical protein